nr:immunoglobulin light chain junction region [Macaca mulatta]
WQQYNSLPFTF